MSKLKVIILDFDGVLAESNNEKTGAFADLFARYPKYADAMMAHHKANQALSRLHKFEHYAAELFGRPGDKDLIDELLKGFSELVEKRVADCPDVPGAREFLQEFHQITPCYISSHTPREELHRIVVARGLDKYVRKVYGYPPTRKTEAMTEVFELENVTPDECLFIGDSPSDRRLAGECDVPFIARDSGLWPDDMDLALHRDMYEIADIVRTMLEK